MFSVSYLFIILHRHESGINFNLMTSAHSSKPSGNTYAELLKVQVNFVPFRDFHPVFIYIIIYKSC